MIPERLYEQYNFIENFIKSDNNVFSSNINNENFYKVLEKFIIKNDFANCELKNLLIKLDESLVPNCINLESYKMRCKIKKMIYNKL